MKIKILKNKNSNKVKITLFFIICILAFTYTNNKNIPTVTVSKNENLKLIPSGQAVAMKLKTNGVMVVGTEENMPARKSGIKVGDILTYANDVKILNTKHFSDIILKSNGEKLTIKITRKNKELTVDLTATRNEAEQLVCGMWLRDSAAGIGTVSFYNAEKTKFYALGHSVSDSDTNEMYDVRKGDMALVEITGSKKGEKNNPGELMGNISDYKIGNILKNTHSGITGEIYEKGIILEQEMETLKKNEVSLGKAYIMSTVSNKGVGKYEIEIMKILNGEENKDFIIKVTDETLINETGGIVRGMSGSPIIQNNKIVGAVTHVFVNDPTRGYGIFIENMLAEAEKIN